MVGSAVKRFVFVSSYLHSAVNVDLGSRIPSLDFPRRDWYFANERVRIFLTKHVLLTPRTSGGGADGSIITFSDIETVFHANGGIGGCTGSSTFSGAD